jgi:hypothetical protein
MWTRVPKLTTLGCLCVCLIALGLLGWLCWYNLNPNPHGLSSSAWHELVAARVEHHAIVDLRSACPPEASGIVSTHELTEIVPDDDSANADQAQPDKPMPGYLMAAVFLSNAIGRARVEAATEVARYSLSMQGFEWAIILIGAASTVLVSLKSAVSNESSLALPLSIVAIVASALATSASGLNAFYSPRTEHEKSLQQLISLQHLHADLAGGMMREAGVAEAICGSMSGDKDWKFRRIKNFSDRFQAILVTPSAGMSGTGGDAEGEAVDTTRSTAQHETPPSRSGTKGTAKVDVPAPPKRSQVSLQ